MSDGAGAKITHRRILAISLPIILSNATIPILGAVDTAVVGQIGAAAPIGAVGIGAIFIAGFYWVFGFLRMGTVGLASQALGAQDQGELDALLSRVLLIGFAAGALLILLQLPLIAAAFSISPASPEVEALARQYMSVRIWSAPAAIAIYGITGWLIAIERTRAVLVLQLWMNGLNIALDLWFVLDLGWGVRGVAFATFLAEWSGLIVGLWFCRDAFRRPHWRALSRICDQSKLTHMLKVNSDITIRSVLLQAIFISFLLLGARHGDTPLAANQVLLQFLYVTAFAMDGIAFSAETLVGQAVGARNRLLLRRSAAMTTVWGAGICVLLSAVFWVAGPALIDLMTTAPDVRAAARDFLPWMAIAPVLGFLPWMLDGIFIGATRTADMRNMMVVSAAIYALAAAMLSANFGNHGLWAALIISFIARGVTLATRYSALEAATENET